MPQVAPGEGPVQRSDAQPSDGSRPEIELIPISDGLCGPSPDGGASLAYPETAGRRGPATRTYLMKRLSLTLLVVTLLSGSLFAQRGIHVTPGSPRPRAFDWNERTAGHLARRAGFSASPSELKRMVDQGLTATLAELLHPELVDNSEMEAGLAARGLELTVLDPVDQAFYANTYNMNRWWLYRMIHSRHQLVEKMTLFLHDHFATSAVEIGFVDTRDGVSLAMRQHRLLRRHALGNFRQLVHEMAKDPAMLLWLDNFINFAQEPNENWARELMELFTMGVDEYSEADVQNAARAFTGWTFNFRALEEDGAFEFNFNILLHDFGLKSFLGREGAFNGGDVIDIIFEQDVTAEFMARKIWEFLAYKDPPQTLVKELARVFRESNYEMVPLLSAIFRHPEFYSESAVRSQIKSPVEFVSGFARELELDEHEFMAGFLYFLNQFLFAPPDVGGWLGGVTWINTSSLLDRYNYLNAYTAYSRIPEFPQIDFAGIIEDHNLRTEEDFVDHFGARFLQGDVQMDTRLVLEEYMRRRDDGSPGAFELNPQTVDTKVRGLIHLITLLPAYQLN